MGVVDATITRIVASHILEWLVRQGSPMSSSSSVVAIGRSTVTKSSRHALTWSAVSLQV